MKFGWLGAKQRAVSGAGLILLGARLYNIATGLFSSTDPVPGGNANAYTYPTDPVNSFDLDGMKKCKKWICKWVSKNRHKIVNFGVGFAAAVGTAACIASVVCGAGLFAVGAAALFAGGLTAHYAVSSRAERRRGMGRHFKSTLWAESKGIVCGASFGRGCATGLAFGARKHKKRSVKYFFSGIPRRHYARRIGRAFRDLW